MVKIRIIKNADWHADEKREMIRTYGHCWDKEFFDLLEGRDRSEGEGPPFRDRESVLFLREYGCAEFEGEEWYAIRIGRDKQCISAIYSDEKCGLVIIHNSKKGLYTYIEDVGDSLLKALADLEMEVLIAMPESFVACELNWLWWEEEVAVTLEGDFSRDNWCKGWPYDWKNDLEGIVKVFEEETRNELSLDMHEKELDIWQLNEALGLRNYRWPKEAEQVKIVNRIAHRPKGYVFEKAPMQLILDRKDGKEIELDDELYYKHPDMDSFISEAIDWAAEMEPNAEKMVLVTNANYKIEDRYEIVAKLYCGFLIKRDRVVLLDRCEAMMEFGKRVRMVLEERKERERCSGSN